MTRKLAIESIKVDILKHGDLTSEGMRIYIEHRISRATLNNLLHKYYNREKATDKTIN